MKQLVGRTLAFVLLTVLSVAGIAQGQVQTWVIKVNIPFEFNIGDKTFPAGSYSLVQPLQHLLALRDARGQTIASVLTNGVDSTTAPSSSKLKFESIDGRYVLSQVWQQHDPAGLQLVQAKSLTSFAKHRTSQSGDIAEGSQP